LPTKVILRFCYKLTTVDVDLLHMAYAYASVALVHKQKNEVDRAYDVRKDATSVPVAICQFKSTILINTLLLLQERFRIRSNGGVML
jgi:hypothetical protein